ncbi:MAG TPA: PKD domain-containing protein, partial [Thermoplasmatales archaeon]|nr:PKD domain-containing protein [Thermoplasmatales archaeon]HEX17706.1 PKD domain-containing protein [Thermoplasmatales archaeon]
MEAKNTKKLASLAIAIIIITSSLPQIGAWPTIRIDGSKEFKREHPIRLNRPFTLYIRCGDITKSLPIRLFLPVKIDLDNDGHSDLKVSFSILPSISKFAFSLRMRLKIEILSNIKGPEDPLEIYVIHHPTLWLFRGLNTKFGVKVPPDTPIPSKYLVEYGFKPYIFSRRGPEASIVIIPEETEGKLTTVLGISSQRGKTSEKSIECSVYPSSRLRITVKGLEKDDGFGEVGLSSSRDVSVTILHKVVKDGEEREGGIYIERLPRKGKFIYSLRLLPSPSGEGGIFYRRISKEDLRVLFFVRKNLSRELPYFYIKYLPDNLNLNYKVAPTGWIVYNASSSYIPNEIGWCDDLFEPRKKVYLSNLSTYGRVEWKIHSIQSGQLDISIDMKGCSLNALFAEGESLLKFRLRSMTDLDLSARWDVRKGIFHVERNPSNLTLNLEIRRTTHVESLTLSAYLGTLSRSSFDIRFGSCIHIVHPSEIFIKELNATLRDVMLPGSIIDSLYIRIRDLRIFAEESRARSGHLTLLPSYEQTSLLPFPRYAYIHLHTSKGFHLSVGECVLKVNIVERNESTEGAEREEVPKVSITHPASGATVGGNVEVKGSATPATPERDIEFVEIRIRRGEEIHLDWKRVEGTDHWHYLWDTRGLPDGNYSIDARCYDGKTYSDICTVNVSLDNVQINVDKPEEGETLSGTVEIKGNVCADRGIQEITVRVLSEDRTIEICRCEGVTSWSCEWDTRDLPNGDYVIEISVLDTFGWWDNKHVNVILDNGPEFDRPIVTIDQPSIRCIVSGVYTIKGKVYSSSPDRPVKLVQLRIEPTFLKRLSEENESWIDISPSLDKWSYTWDTSSIPFGAFVIKARCFDGRFYSKTTEVKAIVNNLDFRIPEGSFVLYLSGERNSSVEISNFHLEVQRTLPDNSLFYTSLSFDRFSWNKTGSSYLLLNIDRKNYTICLARGGTTRQVHVEGLFFQRVKLFPKGSPSTFTFRIDEMRWVTPHLKDSKACLDFDFEKEEGKTLNISCRLNIPGGILVKGIYVQKDNKTRSYPSATWSGPCQVLLDLSISSKKVRWDISQDLRRGWITVGSGGSLEAIIDTTVFRDNQLLFSISGSISFASKDGNFTISWDMLGDRKVVIMEGRSILGIDFLRVRVANDILDIFITKIRGDFTAKTVTYRVDGRTKVEGEFTFKLSPEGRGHLDFGLNLNKLNGIFPGITMRGEVIVGLLGYISLPLFGKIKWSEEGLESVEIGCERGKEGLYIGASLQLRNIYFASGDKYLTLNYLSAELDIFLDAEGKATILTFSAKKLTLKNISASLSSDLDLKLRIEGVSCNFFSLGECEFSGEGSLSLIVGQSNLTVDAEGYIYLYLSSVYIYEIDLVLGYLEAEVDGLLFLGLNSKNPLHLKEIESMRLYFEGAGYLTINALGSAEVLGSAEMIVLAYLSVGGNGRFELVKGPTGPLFTMDGDMYFTACGSFDAGAGFVDLKHLDAAGSFYLSGSEKGLFLEVYAGQASLDVLLSREVFVPALGSEIMGCIHVVLALQGKGTLSLGGPGSFALKLDLLQGSGELKELSIGRIYFASREMNRYYLGDVMVSLYANAGLTISVGKTYLLFDPKKGVELYGNLRGEAGPFYLSLKGKKGELVVELEELRGRLSFSGSYEQGNIHGILAGDASLPGGIKIIYDKVLILGAEGEIKIEGDFFEFLWSPNNYLHIHGLYLSLSGKCHLLLLDGLIEMSIGAITTLSIRDLRIERIEGGVRLSTYWGGLSIDAGVGGWIKIHNWSGSGWISFRAISLRGLGGIEGGDISIIFPSWQQLPTYLRLESSKGSVIKICSLTTSEGKEIDLLQLTMGRSSYFEFAYLGMYRDFENCLALRFSGNVKVDVIKTPQFEILSLDAKGNDASFLLDLAPLFGKRKLGVMAESDGGSTVSAVIGSSEKGIQIDIGWNGDLCAKLEQQNLTIKSSRGFNGYAGLTGKYTGLTGKEKELSLYIRGEFSAGYFSASWVLGDEKNRIEMDASPKEFLREIFAEAIIPLGKRIPGIRVMGNFWVDDFWIEWDTGETNVNWSKPPSKHMGGNVMVWVTSDGGESWTNIIPRLLGGEVSEKPIADAGGPYYGEVGESIRFDFSGSFSPTGRLTHMRVDWDGDGKWDTGSLLFFRWISFNKHPTHTYYANGTYILRLQVKDSSGMISDIGEAIVTIGGTANKPPVARFHMIPDPTTDHVTFGETIIFYGTDSYDPDGKIVRYEWDFGDGSKVSGRDKDIVSHEYYAGESWHSGYYREFTVTLTVVDDSGLKDSYSVTFKIYYTGPANTPPKVFVHAFERSPGQLWEYRGSTPANGEMVLKASSENEYKFTAYPPPTPYGGRKQEGTRDPDGYIRAYKWDWETDDHSMETTGWVRIGEGEKIPPLATLSWRYSGTYMVSLSVRDNEGGFSSAIVYVKVEGAFSLINPKVEPESGDENTIFRFSVVYMDEDGDEPTIGQLIIDDKDVYYPLQHDDAPVEEGRLYYYDIPGSALPPLPEGAKKHRFKFRFANPVDGSMEVSGEGPLALGLRYPVAIITIDKTTVKEMEVITLSASGSYDPDGSITGCRWDFEGDGKWDTDWMDKDQPVQHFYTSVGRYTVILEVKDNDGLTNCATKEVTVRSVTGKPLVKTLSATEITKHSAKLRGLIVDDGGYECKVSFRWWKEGEKGWKKKNLPGTYRSGDIFCLTLTGLEEDTLYYFVACASNEKGMVEDGTKSFFTGEGGESKEITVSIERYPTGDVSVNEKIHFYGYASGGNPPYEWLWLFGDGLTSTERNPVHAYSRPGEMTVRLIVTDRDGNEGEDSIVIRVTGGIPPHADPGGPYFAGVGEYFFISAEDSYDPDGEIVYYKWDLGDGRTVEGENAVDIYLCYLSPPPSGDYYVITLTVIDNDGLSDTATT